MCVDAHTSCAYVAATSLSCCSNQTLQQQLVGFNDECHSSKRALLQSESQKMGLQQQVDHLQRQLHLATAGKQELQGTIHDL